jgi:hypothetical protein
MVQDYITGLYFKWNVKNSLTSETTKLTAISTQITLWYWKLKVQHFLIQQPTHNWVHSWTSYIHLLSSQPIPLRFLLMLHSYLLPNFPRSLPIKIFCLHHVNYTPAHCNCQGLSYQRISWYSNNCRLWLKIIMSQKDANLECISCKYLLYIQTRTCTHVKAKICSHAHTHISPPPKILVFNYHNDVGKTAMLHNMPCL